MKAYRGVALNLYAFFNLGARRGWVVNAALRPLYPRERPGTQCTGGWVGPQGRPRWVRKTSPPHRDSIPVPSSP